MADYIISGPARVLSHGMATAFMGHPLSVSFQLPDDSWYRIDFRCSVDPAGSEPTLGVEAHPWGIDLELRNFDGGRGSSVPVLLGESTDELFFLHFRVFRYGKTVDHTVHWTAYVGSKQELNWKPAEPSAS